MHLVVLSLSGQIWLCFIIYKAPIRLLHCFLQKNISLVIHDYRQYKLQNSYISILKAILIRNWTICIKCKHFKVNFHSTFKIKKIILYKTSASSNKVSRTVYQSFTTTENSINVLFYELTIRNEFYREKLFLLEKQIPYARDFLLLEGPSLYSI